MIPMAWLLPRWFTEMCLDILYAAHDILWEGEEGPVTAGEELVTAPGGTVGPQAGS